MPAPSARHFPRSTKLSLNENFPRMMIGGLVAGLLGLAFFLNNVGDAPPTLAQLAREDARISAPLRIVPGTSGKSARSAYIVVPFAHMEAAVLHGCNTNVCAVPPGFAELRPGTSVRVWLNGKVIWQLQHEEKILLNYLDVRADEQRYRFAHIALGIVLMLAGGTVIWWSLRPEPPTPKSFFD